MEISSSVDIRELNERIHQQSAFIELLNMELNKAVVGQKHMVERLMIGLLANGHVLLEGVPGLAKTLAIKSLASAIQARFARIQFMQERQVTIGDNTYKLEEPFLVLATQNPIEQEGTYELPEAQVDRFMLKIVITYPKKEEERQIIRTNLNPAGMSKINPVVSVEDITRARHLVREVYMDEKIEQYILDIVFATRFPEEYKLGKLKPFISYGGSPRASINLALAAKAYAFIKRRGYVIPEDIRAVCHDVMRHRIGISYEAEAENVTSEQILNEILNVVEVP